MSTQTTQHQPLHVGSAEGPHRTDDHYIDGTSRSGNSYLDRYAPGTGALVAVVAVGEQAHVADAVRAARRTFESGDWAGLTASDRSRVLHRAADLIDARADLLARLDAEESGKPLRIAQGDIAGAAELTRYAASLGYQQHGTTYTNYGNDFTGIVLREPAGVVALITPWNFPALIASQKLPFALAAGCSVVLKPSELTPSSAIELAKIYTEAGLPDGVFNVVMGDGLTGKALCEQPGLDVISFTGSTRSGRSVMETAAVNMTKVSLELGGKAANIVFEDADLDLAAEGVTFGVFFNNGECCVSQARLLVQNSVADEFVEQVVARSQRLRVGQPLEVTSDVGALINSGHLDSVLASVEGAADAGARIAAGGVRASGPNLDDGLYMQPTVLTGVTAQMEAFSHEIFGPVLTVTRFEDEADAVRLANSVEYGLANTIWSANVDTVLSVSKRLRSGTVYVNTTIDGPPVMPFGGYGKSGIGREMGVAGFEEFTELKSVNIRTNRAPGSFLFGA